jgi:hypothetical protein
VFPHIVNSDLREIRRTDNGNDDTRNINRNIIQRLPTIGGAIIRVHSNNDSLNRKEQEESQKKAKPHTETKLAKDAHTPSSSQRL